VEDCHTNCVPLLGDDLWNNAWPRALDAPAPCSVDSGWPEDEQVGEMNYFCIDRHDGGLNLLFIDWSARNVGSKELCTLKWHRQFNTAGPWTKAGGATPEDWPEWMRKFTDYRSPPT